MSNRGKNENDGKRRVKSGKELCLEYSHKQVKRRLPIVGWLPDYDWKSYLLYDIASGFTIACICVPQGLAFAVLANVDLIYGLNTCCFPALIYSFLGTAKYSSIGSVALTSILIGQNVAQYDYETASFSRSEYVASLTIIIGLYYMLIFIFRLYFVTVAFKKPFISAFLTAVVFYIMLKSLKLVLGIGYINTHTGLLNFFYNSVTLFSNVDKSNPPTVILSAIVLCIFACNHFILVPWVKKHAPYVVIPIETIVMVVTIFLSYFIGFSRFRIALIDDVPTGLPALTTPSIPALEAAWLSAIPIAAVNYATTISNIMVFNEDIDTEQEVLTLGICNLTCAWFQCLIIGNSMMRTIVAYTLGLKTLLATTVSAILMFIIILFAGRVFAPLPRAVLGCIMLSAAVKLLYMRIRDVRLFYKSWEDLFIYVVTFVVTMTTTIEIGLVVGLVLSLRKILEDVSKAEEAERGKFQTKTETAADVPEELEHISVVSPGSSRGKTKGSSDKKADIIILSDAPDDHDFVFPRSSSRGKGTKGSSDRRRDELESSSSRKWKGSSDGRSEITVLFEARDERLSPKPLRRKPKAENKQEDVTKEIERPSRVIANITKLESPKEDSNIEPTKEGSTTSTELTKENTTNIEPTKEIEPTEEGTTNIGPTEGETANIEPTEVDTTNVERTGGSEDVPTHTEVVEPTTSESARNTEDK